MGASPCRVIWIETAKPRPVCDVPWLGTSVVLSDGNVNFCCFSDAIVGNVNQASFEAVWDGPTMRRIRRELSEQRFPTECQSNSCPLYRGDQLHYLIERMEGPNGFRATGTHDPHVELRGQLGDSVLRVAGSAGGNGVVFQASLSVRFSGEHLGADVFVGVRRPDGVFHFLPNMETYAVPAITGIELTEQAPSLELNLSSGAVAVAGAPGRYEICAALFESESNPNLASNCYWCANETIEVGPRAA